MTTDFIKGVLLCVAITLLAFAFMYLPFPPLTLASGAHPLEAATLALILGILASSVFGGRYKAGIDFAKRFILSVGVVLLGIQLNVRTLTHLPWELLVALIALVVFIVILALFLGRVFRLSGRCSMLVGLGSAICGSAAIMAGQSVLEVSEEQLAISLAAINLLGLVAIFVLPVVGHLLHMDPNHFGVVAGLSIQAVPQVIAAALTFSPHAAPMATVVKLVRVLMLGPALLGVRLWLVWQNPDIVHHSQTLKQRGRLKSFFQWVPPFIVLFFLMVVLGGFGFFRSESVGDS